MTEKRFPTVPLHIPADAQQAIEKYTERMCASECGGAAKVTELDEARSYAVEALSAILSANPQQFDYRQRLDAIFDARRRK